MTILIVLHYNNKVYLIMFIFPYFSVDLFVMFKVVRELGGYHQVIKYFQFNIIYRSSKSSIIVYIAISISIFTYYTIK